MPAIAGGAERFAGAFDTAWLGSAAAADPLSGGSIEVDCGTAASEQLRELARRSGAPLPPDGDGSEPPEDVDLAGQDFAQLLRTRVFGPAMRRWQRDTLAAGVDPQQSAAHFRRLVASKKVRPAVVAVGPGEPADDDHEGAVWAMDMRPALAATCSAVCA